MSVGEEVRPRLEAGAAREKAETNGSDLLPPRFPLIELVIKGEPLSAPRPRSTSRGPAVFMPTNYTAGRDAIAMLMKAARKRSEPCTGLVHLEVRFHRGT